MTLSGPGPVVDAIITGSADYGTAALPSLLVLWEKTCNTSNEVKAVGTVSNGAMTLYTTNPNVKTIADFTDKDRIAVPTVRISFNAMMLQMAAEKLWNDPHRLDHLTVGLGHTDAVAAMSAGFGRSTVTAHIAVQPFTERGLKIPGAHAIADSHEVFGGPLTQITLLATKQTRDKNPTLFKAVPTRWKHRSKPPLPTSAPRRCFGRTPRRRASRSKNWCICSTTRVSSSSRSRAASRTSRHCSIASAP